jgi:Sec-independent protein translocase protein TatA
MPDLSLFEILIIIILLLLFFRPSTITDLARSAGKVVGEFRKGEKELQTDEDAIKEIATKLGITVEGKTVEQLSEEILIKAEKGQR